jgi:hypothetical protein
MQEAKVKNPEEERSKVSLFDKKVKIPYMTTYEKKFEKKQENS